MVISLFGGGKGNTPSQGQGTAAGGPGDAANDLIKETSSQTFMQDVIEASRDALVLVDFWAPWCGPCKQLTPVLEKVVTAAKGTLRLVKMNIDEHPHIAQQMGVQSIPAVFAFKGGRPLDGFMGALTEAQVRQFIERIAPEAFAEPENVLEQAQAALDAGDAAAAAQLFGLILSDDPENADAIGGMARCYIETQAYDQAEQILSMAPAAHANHAAIAGARAALDLAVKTEKAVGDIPKLEARVAADDDDHAARFDLAVAMAGTGKKQRAVDELIELMRRDRTWNDDGARKQLVELFDAWGPKDPATQDGRRRLSLLLFS